MIQGCVDTKDKKCPWAEHCYRRDSANNAPAGVTLIVAPFKQINEKQIKCEYFIDKHAH